MQLPSGDSQLVQIMDAALADAAKRAGNWLACKQGCTQCCHGAFAISPLDAARLSVGMEALRNTEPTLAATIERRAQLWIAEHGTGFPGDVQTGLLGESDEDKDRFENYANEAACPALDPVAGCCNLYAWRPMTCRVFGPPVRMDQGEALGCCELCFQGASEAEIAACEMQPPHEFEARLLGEMNAQGETVVAYGLLP
jgi:Fe-S-cluster containining protein